MDYPGLVCLESLSLSDTRVTSDFILLGALDGMGRLAKLNLSRTAVCDKGRTTSNLYVQYYSLYTAIHVHVHTCTYACLHQPALSSIRSLVGRALDIESRVSWIRIPPEASRCLAHTL